MVLVGVTMQMRQKEKDVDSQGRVPLLGVAVYRHHRDGVMCSLSPRRRRRRRPPSPRSSALIAGKSQLVTEHPAELGEL